MFQVHHQLLSITPLLTMHHQGGALLGQDEAVR